MAQPRLKSRPEFSNRSQGVRSRLRRTKRVPPATVSAPSLGARRSLAKFRRFFKHGFHDPLYIDWERDYKWEAHKRWESVLSWPAFSELLLTRRYADIAVQAVAIEARTNLLFSFEKMAVRDAVKAPSGARAFAEGLFEFLYGTSDIEVRFAQWCDMVGKLPRRQTRVLTWPVATVFGFIAQPKIHFFLKPMVTRRAADRYGYAFEYDSQPQWQTVQERSCIRAYRVARSTRLASEGHDRHPILLVGSRIG